MQTIPGFALIYLCGTMKCESAVKGGEERYKECGQKGRKKFEWDESMWELMWV